MSFCAILYFFWIFFISCFDCTSNSPDLCIIGHPKGSKVAAPVKAEVQKEAPPIEVPALSVDELKEKTDNFGSKALIGEGSYGRVYYANLDNGKAVALKKLDVTTEPESNVEFLTQVCF